MFALSEQVFNFNTAEVGKSKRIAKLHFICCDFFKLCYAIFYVPFRAVMTDEFLPVRGYNLYFFFFPGFIDCCCINRNTATTSVQSLRRGRGCPPLLTE